MISDATSYLVFNKNSLKYIDCHRSLFWTWLVKLPGFILVDLTGLEVLSLTTICSLTPSNTETSSEKLDLLQYFILYGEMCSFMTDFYDSWNKKEHILKNNSTVLIHTMEVDGVQNNNIGTLDPIDFHCTDNGLSNIFQCMDTRDVHLHNWGKCDTHLKV